MENPLDGATLKHLTGKGGFYFLKGSDFMLDVYWSFFPPKGSCTRREI